MLVVRHSYLWAIACVFQALPSGIRGAHVACVNDARIYEDGRPGALPRGHAPVGPRGAAAGPLLAAYVGAAKASRRLMAKRGLERQVSPADGPNIETDASSVERGWRTAHDG